jgi:hypothetical protein
MFGDTFMLIFFTNHKASDILQENKRNFSLAAEFNEVSTLHGSIWKENSIISNNSDRVTIESGEARYKCGSIFLFEFLESKILI